MTTALCLACGEAKAGALVACGHCDHAPADLDDRARHLLASDHFRDPGALNALQERLRRGEPPSFEDAEWDSARDVIAGAGPAQVMLFAALLYALPVLLGVSLLLALAWLVSTL